MIALQSQAYYVPGLPKDLRIIYSKVIHTPEGYNVTVISHCHDDHDVYEELNLKEDNPGWHKSEPVKKVYVKYYPNNNLPNHEATITNQREKEVKALESDVCVTNKANKKLTPSYKELL